MCGVTFALVREQEAIRIVLINSVSSEAGLIDLRAINDVIDRRSRIDQIYFTRKRYKITTIVIMHSGF